MSADPDDIAALRDAGDLVSYLLSLAGRTPSQPKPAEAEPEPPSYHIPRKGACPCGTAPSGPTPRPCNDCTSEGSQ